MRSYRSGYLSHPTSYDRFYDIVLDDEAAEFQTAYMAEGVLLTGIVDPRNKMLQLL